VHCIRFLAEGADYIGVEKIVERKSGLVGLVGLLEILVKVV